jgi:hypothetical protein
MAPIIEYHSPIVAEERAEKLYAPIRKVLQERNDGNDDRR